MHKARRWQFSLDKQKLRHLLPGLVLVATLSLLSFQSGRVDRTLAARAINTAYVTDWLANSYGTSDNHIQGSARSMYVAADGSVYADTGWDENGKNVGIYRDGQSVGQFNGGGGDTGVTSNGNYFFAADSGNTSMARFNPDGSHAGSVSISGNVSGLTANGDTVYVSANGTIFVYNANSLNQLNSFSVPNSGKLTFDPNDGTLWIVSGKSVLHYGTDGTALGQQITSGLGQPTGLTIDNSDHLLVADAGQDYNIKIYSNISSSPTLSSTFGVAGGIYAGTGNEIGTYRPLHFNYPNDVGVDSSGNIYVIDSPPNVGASTIIESYTPSGAQRWVVYGLNFEANGDVDPASDGSDVYSSAHHFKMDYTKAPGQGWSYAGYTINPFKYPNDPRINGYNYGFASVRTIQGHRLLFTTGQNGGNVDVTRFNPATDGEVGIPTRSFGNLDGYYVDGNGNFWACQGTTITRFPLQGFDGNGAPQWGAGQAFQAPTEWNQVNRLEYNAATDTMILGGYTQSNPSTGDWGRVGAALVRYDGWTSNPTKRWEISPILYGNGIIGSGEPQTISMAGDYLFIGHFSYPFGPIQQAYDLNTGNLVTTFTQNGGVYAGNDVDSYYGVKAFLRSNGEYVILKDDYNAYKIVMYRWCPSGNCPENSSAPSTQTPTSTSTATPIPTSTPTSGSLVAAINAGGSSTKTFVADTDYDQGNTYSDTSSSINTDGVSNPAPQGVYQTCRWNSAFTYTIPKLVAGAGYTVRLHFAELTFATAGQRVFNVAINGKSVLSDFDVFATVGAQKKALVETFTVTADSNGKIAIAFTQGSADNPFVSGIEIYTS